MIMMIIMMMMMMMMMIISEMVEGCKRFHSRLAELLSIKKGEDYATIVSLVTRWSLLAILRSTLHCLRGSRSKRRTVNIQENDLRIENVSPVIRWIFFKMLFCVSFYKSTMMLNFFKLYIQTVHTKSWLDKVVKVDELVFWHSCE